MIPIAILLLLFAHAPSSEWKPPVTAWPQEAVDRLLQNSPWAIPTDATMNDPADVPERDTSPLPSVAPSGVPGRTYAGANGPRWDGGIGKTRKGSLAVIPVLVRWDSAGLVRQALQREHTTVTQDDGKHFILTVIGLLPAKRSASPAATIKPSSSSDAGENAPQNPEETLEWFMANSRLLVKGKPALQPQNAKVDAATGTLQLFFPRNDGFIQNKLDILFVTRYGAMNVQTRFRTKDMLVNGAPDL